MTQLLRGIVVRIHGKRAVVRCGQSEYECEVAGKLKKGKREQSSPVAAGDEVDISIEAGQSGSVEAVHPRRTVLSRQHAHLKRREHVMAANVDQLIIFIAANRPTQHLELVDRLLVASQRENIRTAIVLNKVDLDESGEARAVLEVYRKLPWPALAMSALTGEGVPQFAALLKDKVSVLAGPSGAGKSTSLNAVQSGLSLRTGDVNEKSGTGRHTTTHVTLIPLEQGGYVADTPGVREFSLFKVAPDELALWYPDFMTHLPNCRFPGCTHLHEPGCAVKLAVETGVVDRDRYKRYLLILDAHRAG